MWQCISALSLNQNENQKPNERRKRARDRVSENKRKRERFREICDDSGFESDSRAQCVYASSHVDKCPVCVRACVCVYICENEKLNDGVPHFGKEIVS